MAHVVADRVWQTTTTTGTIAVTLSGTVAGYRSMSVIGNGNTTYYAIADQSGVNWEVGVGTYTSATTSLARTTVLASSNAGALVDFTAGTKDVICVAPAGKSVLYDPTGHISALTGGISTADYVDFDLTAGITPTAARVSWDVDNGCLNVGLAGGNTDVLIGIDQHMKVYNGTGSPLVKGQVVYVTGAQGNTLQVALAQANSEATSASTLAMVTETIANGSSGYCLNAGLLRKMNTLGMTEGAAIYLSPSTPGGWTVTKPTAPDHIVILGWITRAHQTVGSLYIKINNGYEIDELHNVLVTGLADQDVLQYEASTTLWKNKPRIKLGTVASSATISINAGTTDQYTVTALALGTTIAAPTGTPVDGQRLTIRLKDNGVSRTIAWNAAFRAIGVTLPTTTVASKTVYAFCVYNSADAVWDVVDVKQQV